MKLLYITLPLVWTAVGGTPQQTPPSGDALSYQRNRSPPGSRYNVVDGRSRRVSDNDNDDDMDDSSYRPIASSSSKTTSGRSFLLDIDDDDDYDNDFYERTGTKVIGDFSNMIQQQKQQQQQQRRSSSKNPRRQSESDEGASGNDDSSQSRWKGVPRDTKMLFDKGSDVDKGVLYDAYNQLHILAQAYSKPFDAPAVVVVGHQSSGKSALIEALMGFQFNQVGGGTKTRRPVALRMQYNPNCFHPKCYLVGDDGVERAVTLSEVQDYIDRENRRLERDPGRSFDPREIHVRMEYKYCPNMILIDTPGLIAAPRVPPQGRGAGAALAQQRALQMSAREAERLCVEKMRCDDYIILCIEDTSDWKHGYTRDIVQKADPDLSRTVIVNTKLDTKIPQFGTPSDVDDFLRAGIMDRLCPHRLGGPFFTSVPSGRVGRRLENLHVDAHLGDFLFDTDDEFVVACADAENADRAVVNQKLKRSSQSKTGAAADVVNASVMNRIGISRLRAFLEQRVDECYRRNVAKIIPMLQAEYVAAEKRIQSCEKELEALSVERLKAGAEAFCEEFCVCLRKAMQGSIVAPAAIFGETLAQETAAAGSFHDVHGSPMAVSDRTWDRFLESEVGNQGHRLYGGSQYHRTLREFNLAGKCLRLPSIAEDEIANAAGIGDTHDGVNFLHAACVIALEKARTSFEPLLGALQVRVTHVMTRLCPVVEYMIREGKERSKIQNVDLTKHDILDDSIDHAMDISQNPQFRQLIRTIFDKFVQRCSDSAVSKCRDDLNSITRFVTWNLDERSGGALKRSLPDQSDLVSVYQVVLQQRYAFDNIQDSPSSPSTSSPSQSSISSIPSGALTQAEQALKPIDRNSDRDYFNLLQLMEEAAMSRDANRTNLVVGGLVHHIVGQWREQFCRTVTTKFNCYFMLPFVEDFHRFIRRELQRVYEGEDNRLTEVFDLTSARRALQVQREELIGECLANKRLQEKFESCARMMRKKQQDPESDSASQQWFSEAKLFDDNQGDGEDDDGVNDA